jgi:hypothetical protein
MYNVPSFTLARSVGGLIALYWRNSGRDETRAIVLASVSPVFLFLAILVAVAWFLNMLFCVLTSKLQGFILGEGFLSVVNLFLQTAGVPHH